MKINNGLLLDVDIYNVDFYHELIPVTSTKARPRVFMQPEFITIHNTGNPDVNAKANSNYIKNHNDYKSWHFTIDNKDIFQQMPINEIAWHAGDGENGRGNRKSIGIEIAEVDGAEETAIKFIAQLMQVTDIDIENVVPHKKWSGKECPRLILKHWDMFISNLERELLKTPSMTLDKALKALADNKIINSPEYWKDKAKADEYLDDLIINMANFIK